MSTDAEVDHLITVVGPLLIPTPAAVLPETTAGGPWGEKMPAAARKRAETGIAQAQDKKQQEADAVSPFFSFLGLKGVTWQGIGVYLILFILFLVGVIGLLNAAGVKTPLSK